MTFEDKSQYNVKNLFPAFSQMSNIKLAYMEVKENIDVELIMKLGNT